MEAASAGQKPVWLDRDTSVIRATVRLQPGETGRWQSAANRRYRRLRRSTPCCCFWAARPATSWVAAACSSVVLIPEPKARVYVLRVHRAVADRDRVRYRRAVGLVPAPRPRG